MKKIICVLVVFFIGISNYLFADNNTPLRTGQNDTLPLMDRIRELKPERKELTAKSENNFQEIESNTKSPGRNGKKYVQNPVKALTVKAATLFKEGLGLYNTKRYQEAIGVYSESLKLTPKDASIFFNRGLTYQHIAQYDEAISDYNHVIELTPWSADVYYNRGIAYHQLGELDSAIKDYSKAIELDPNDANAYWNRGIALSDKGEYGRAASDYCKVIDMKPTLTAFEQMSKK